MENIAVSIVVIRLLQLPSNGLHNAVSNSIAVVVEAWLLCRCMAMVLALHLFLDLCLATDLYAAIKLSI
jgi:hypothetical protein